MNWANRLLKYKKSIVIIFTLLAVIGGIVQFAVPVNYSMTDYLPKSAPSTEALEVMKEEFDEDVANLRVMVKSHDIQEALIYKEKLEHIDGIPNVLWLDDVFDLHIPLEMADQDLIESYYKDGYALFNVDVDKGAEVEVTDAIYEVIGEENALSGEALDTAVSQQAAGKETFNAAAILVPIIILILILSTTSWIEPLFFLTAIGISILINLGTNIFIGEISFISQAVAPILQLAVSLDYAIFLLHSFNDYRQEIEDPTEAMTKAMGRSFPAITASAATTFFGFMALTFMEFGIGSDLGLNLVKGILLSFLSVMVFLPALTLLFYKYIDQTRHRPFMPTSYSIGKFTLKLRIPMIVIILLISIPAFLAQSETNFLYGMGGHPESSRAGQDEREIEEIFGKYSPLILLLPKGDLAREESLINDLKSLDPVKSVISYSEIVGLAIPPEFLEPSDTEAFFSDHYSRVIVNTTLEKENELAFAFVEAVRDITHQYYGDQYYATGENVTLYDMKQVVEKDNTLVNALTVITIALVLLVTFRSLSFPILLLLTIQASVWINLSIPYFIDDSLVYIGYLIISIVQLAATVDYAILFSEDYTQRRKDMPALEAIKQTINEKVFSIAVPASILSSVGFILWLTSSDPIISSIGILLGRGTLLAFILVVLFLPALLVVFDRLIEKTTWKANFFKGRDSIEN